MQRTAPVVGDEKGREELTCESYGYTMDGDQIWWIPETKETFVFAWDVFRPYDGPVLHGTGYTF